MDIPSADDLKLPEILRKIIMVKRGLVLFVGGTGTGKSTSLAALIDHRNSTSKGHIITIEDPVEEIRDQETMEHALAFAETGHLCISTLHANSANQALDRVINFFPEERRPQLLADLANNLQAFVSQRLVPTVTGSRAAAFEIMLGSALFNLVKSGEVSEEEAVLFSDSPNNLRLKLKLENADAVVNDPGASSLSLTSVDGEEEEEPTTEVAFIPPTPPEDAGDSGIELPPLSLELEPTDSKKMGNG